MLISWLNVLQVLLAIAYLMASYQLIRRFHQIIARAMNSNAGRVTLYRNVAAIDLPGTTVSRWKPRTIFDQDAISIWAR